LAAPTALVGKNDAGKSAVLRALDLFFNPPKRGGVAPQEVHQGGESRPVVIELVFDPSALETTAVRIDAKNDIDVTADRLVDEDGLLRVRFTASTKTIEKFELRVQDVDDPQLFPLALKNHDELLELLQKCGLPAVKAGSETNQEKRNALRAWAERQGSGTRSDWVDASAIERAVRQILPSFAYFTDDSNYSIGQTAVQNQFKGVIDAAMATVPEATRIEDEIRLRIQTEFDEVAERLNGLMSGQAALTADPKVSWKKAVDSIGLSWADEAGTATPFEQRGAGMRRLFMVAYFQYQAARSLHDSGGPRYVFAVEEPEVHLHPGAQRELAAALQDLAAARHSVVFTTHSPTFAAAVPLENVLLISRDGMSSAVRQSPQVGYEMLAQELGVEASDRLVGKDYVVLVEGPGDVDFYSHLLRELHSSGDTALDPDKLLFLPCGGIGSLKYWVTTACMDEAGLHWAVVTDSDRLTAGDPPSKHVQSVIAALPASCKYAHTLERTCIENYLDSSSASAVTGVSCVIHDYGKGTDASGSALTERQWKKIKSNLVPIATHMGLTGLKSKACDANGNCEWVLLFENIRVAFGL
jgi:hypothetical protein